MGKPARDEPIESFHHTSLAAPQAPAGRTSMTKTFPTLPSRVLRIGAAAAAMAALASCQSLQRSDSVVGVFTPYKLEIVQGNVITQEQGTLIKPGMTRAQVRDVLGSPLLADPFHADRWDYVFSIRRQGAEPQLRRVVVLFKGEAMESIDTGGPLPAEREFITSIDTYRVSREAPPLALTEAQLKALPVPVRPPPPEPVPPAPQRSYPPLEPRS
jgi:outer membrane protein assembly factor BamE